MASAKDYLGSENIKKIYLGTEQIKKGCLGTELVYGSFPDDLLNVADKTFDGEVLTGFTKSEKGSMGWDNNGYYVGATASGNSVTSSTTGVTTDYPGNETARIYSNYMDLSMVDVLVISTQRSNSGTDHGSKYSRGVLIEDNSGRQSTEQTIGTTKTDIKINMSTLSNLNLENVRLVFRAYSYVRNGDATLDTNPYQGTVTHSCHTHIYSIKSE